MPLSIVVTRVSVLHVAKCAVYPMTPASVATSVRHDATRQLELINPKRLGHRPKR